MTRMVRELYVSVDVEADGPYPGDYSMTSLGAVLAGYRDSEDGVHRLDPTAKQNRFYSEIAPISENWDPEAMAVGLFSGFGESLAFTDPDGSQRREYILQHGENARLAMTRFATWVEQAKEEYSANAIFAGYPLGYDWMWSYWYLCKFSRLPSPFGHSRHIDIKTLYAEKADTLISRSIKSNIPRRLRSKLPHTHLSVDDAAEQGDLLMNLLEWEGKPRKGRDV